jgi:hypothetical protein
MFKFLKHVNAPSDAIDSRPLPPSTSPAHAPSSIRPNTDIQRELIRVVLKDTLRRNGIPFEWLSCEVVTLAHGNTSEELHIQLMFMQWHELFLRYAPALEQQLLRGLDRFDPAVDHSKYTISWRFSPECGCPFKVMPPAVVWSHDAQPESTDAQPQSVLDRRHSRREPMAPATHPDLTPAMPPTPRRDEDPGAYERTELSPFR